MVPLEMKGMIRYCHPPTPLVGLYRQSCCPVTTKKHYDKARIERDIICFPSMLHQMVSRFKAYRALRRLWIQVIHILLSKGLFCNYLTHYTMEYLSLQNPDDFPPFVYPYPRYEWTTIRQRFVQMSGRLASLGYSALVLPHIEDYEYETYLTVCPETKHQELTDLYQELVRKKVQKKWRIMWSYLRRYKEPFYHDTYYLPQYEAGESWDAYCNMKKVDIYLDKCLKLNRLDFTEIGLIHSWISYMKYNKY